MARKPELHSVWRDRARDRFIITRVEDDGPEPWSVTLVAYADRFKVDSIRVELDADTWAQQVKTRGLVQIGTEPGDYPV
ncbi:hypothetical protein [Cupriavidus sp. 8B]